MKRFLYIIASFFICYSTAWAQIDWTTQTYENYTGTNYEGSARGNSIVTDGQNNVYVTGEMDGLATFDTISLDDDLGHMYLAKYQSDGELVWARQVDGNSNNQSNAVALNSLGDVFITGDYQHTNSNTILNFGPFTMEGNRRKSGFIAKCGADGTFAWANRILAEDSPGSFVDPVDMVVAANGDLIVIGNFENPVTIDGQTFNPTNEREASFIARFDGDGNLLWFRHNENGGPFTNIEFAHLEIGSAGQLYVNGTYSGDPLWGTDTMTAPESADHFIACFDANGDLEWVRTQLSRGLDQVPNQFGIDDQDNIYFPLRAGGGDIVFDEEVISGTNFTGRFIFLKYNAQGDRVETRSFVRQSDGAISAGIQDGSLLTHCAPDGTVFMSGDYAGGSTNLDYIIFGEQDSFLIPNVFTDDPAHFILSLNADGTYRDVAFMIDEYLTPPNTNSEFKPLALTYSLGEKLLLTGEFKGVFKAQSDTLQTVSTLDQLFIIQADPEALFDVSTSLEQQLLAARVKTFPNPASNWLHLELAPELQSKPISWFLIQMNGQILGQGINADAINVKGLPSGLYTLIMKIGDQRLAKKIVIRH